MLIQTFSDNKLPAEDAGNNPAKVRPLAYKVAIFYLFILGTQFVWIEGMSISLIKVAALVLSPVLFLLCRVRMSGAWFFGGLYFILILASLWLRNLPITLSVGYTLGCLCAFATFHSLLEAKVFDYDDALDILKKLIYLYAAVLLLQQIKAYTGIGYAPVINFYSMVHNGLFKFNSLFIEPSHFGRVMAVVLFAFLELKRLRYGEKLSVKKLWETDRWVLIAGIYSLIMSGSGAAIVALMIVCGYIIMRGSPGVLFVGCIVFFALLPILEKMDNVHRAVSTIEVSTTMDINKIRENDSSAAARVAPIIAFIENFRPGASDFWRGQTEGSSKYYANIGIIEFYGVMSYIGLLLLLFGCCFRGIFSLEFIFFCGLFAATVGNVAYVWFSMMIFAIVKYFYQQKLQNSSVFSAETNTDNSSGGEIC